MVDCMMKMAPPGPLVAQSAAAALCNGGALLPDAKAKQVLKEAVDAVVNSFAKHTQGYGRGKSKSLLRCCLTCGTLCHAIHLIHFNPNLR